MPLLRLEPQIEKDPVAAYYLALLAFEKTETPSDRLPTSKACENKAKLIKFLQKLPIPADNAKCEIKFVISGEETDPKTLYQDQQSPHFLMRLF